MKNKLIYAVSIVFALALTSCGLIPSQSKSSIEAVNVDENTVAIQGYDPVAYFTVNAPVKGDSQYTANHLGASYWFSSADNLKLFKSNPDKYAPQYGGYCAYGVSKEKKFSVEPDAFSIVGGKLYLNLNKKVQSRWVLNTEELINDADANWTEIENTPASEL